MWKEVFINIISTDKMYDEMKQIGLNSKDIAKEIFDLEDKNKQMSIISGILLVLPKFSTESKLLIN